MSKQQAHDRKFFEDVISSKYDDDPDKKRRIVNLFFDGSLSNSEYQEIQKLLRDTSNNIKEGLDFVKGKDLTRPMSVTRQQQETYLKFQKVRGIFDFQVGPEQSNLYFRIGPQTTYFYIKLDHFLPEHYKKSSTVTYNDGARWNRRLKKTEYNPTVYINYNRRLFRNILNYLKSKDLLDEFLWTFEEKVLQVI